MNVIVKAMETEEEIRGKAYVHWRSWQEAYPGIVPQSYLDRFTLEKCETLAFRWTGNTLVAKDGDRVVGFAAWGEARDGDLTDAGEVSAIYVLAEYHGQGVGSQLMRESLRLLSAFPRVAVWVLKDNERAISFYEKWGYRFDGREQTLQMDAPVTEVRMILERQP